MEQGGIICETGKIFNDVRTVNVGKGHGVQPRSNTYTRSVDQLSGKQSVAIVAVPR